MPELVKCDIHGIIHGKEDECVGCERDRDRAAALVAQPPMSLFDEDNMEDGRRIAHDEREAEAFLADLTDMQNDTKFAWASGTVEGIYETVTRTREVTSNQRRAILNIVDKTDRGYR